MTECSAVEELDSSQHWVEKLFPPHFTFQDLLEGKGYSAEEPRIDYTPLNLQSDRTHSKKQIYLSVLRRVQQQEEMIKRRNLVQRMSRNDKPGDRVSPQVDGQDKHLCETLNTDCNERERCIWNQKDISTIRAALNEIERDRWRLREQLKTSEEQLSNKQEEKNQLQGLLEEREEQLKGSRKEAARQTLVVKTLKMEIHKMGVQLEELAKQSQEKAMEANRLRAEMRKANARYCQIRQECSDLAQELKSVKEQQKIECAREVQATKMEHEAAVVRLQIELDETRAQLRAEKDNHARNLKALEHLRHHFDKR
ncbi:coiled-coil domain-containing protein 160 homolog [Pangasianodon hypophthalmus]|uniref:coiled-coil domain-containing protein 160 homolog n=1 Tax=Pangasianodon hypophthalmus TaxID=310915 RepID=UPI00230708B1|nr:coiled-coil domain-containing protein 160 homolog [Pangasianodon hypophthalmus]